MTRSEKLESSDIVHYPLTQTNSQNREPAGKLNGRPISLRRLPHELRGGVHADLLAPGTVTFVLRAPFKPCVSLVGDFNGWNAQANLMETDGHGCWWTTVAYPGPTRYGFCVAIDDQAHAWVGDPYAAEVHWDETGPWAYLPHPDGMEACRNFGWTDESWRTPALRDLVIYELCVRDFGGEWVSNRPRYGTFEDVRNRLDYFVEMGINAIELMPIQQFPGQSSWGYNPVFYFAPARTYGSPRELKQLVNDCHQRGIAVILDMVFNHAWDQHPYYRIYPPLYGPKGEKWQDWNPFFHHTPRAANMWGGVDWDHFAWETTAHFQDVVRHWIREYHVDGIRFDWVGGVDYDSERPHNPHFNPFHGISAICWAARQEKSDIVLIGEYWPLDGANSEKTETRLLEETEMDAVWNGGFHHTIEDVLVQRWQWERRDICRAIGGFRDLGFDGADSVINYTCSHDEVRPEHEIIFYARKHIDKPEEISWTQAALRKALLGLIALLTAPGIPMLWMGQEYGSDAPRTIDFLPMKWERLGIDPYCSHAEVVKRLIHCRHEHSALRSDHIEFCIDRFTETGVVRFRRWDNQYAENGEGDYALVALNFSSQPRETTLSFPWSGCWQEVVAGRSHHVRNRERTFRLEPWQGRLYVPAGSSLPIRHSNGGR